MKLVLLEQPFASLLISGAISVASSPWGLRPGRVFVGSKPTWSDSCYQEALEWKTEILSLGYKSRSLMPLGKILGTGVVSECDLTYNPEEWKRIQWLDPLDECVPIFANQWAIRFSEIQEFPIPIATFENKPNVSLTKTKKLSILNQVAQDIDNLFYV